MSGQVPVDGKEVRATGGLGTGGSCYARVSPVHLRYVVEVLARQLTGAITSTSG